MYAHQKVRRLVTVSEFEDLSGYSLDGRYLKFLDLVFPDKKLKVSRCKETFRRYDCNDCYGTVFRHFGCGERHICPSCAKARRNELTSKTMDMVSKLLRSYLNMWFGMGDFTIPRNKWLKIRESDLRKLSRLAWRCLVDALRRNAYVLKDSRRDLIFAGMTSINWWHSKDPLKGFYPHIHILVFDRAWDKRLGCWVKVQFQFSKSELKRLRREWCHRVSVLVGEDKHRKEYVVHWRYSDRRRSAWHRVSYMYRSPVSDLYKYIRSGGQFCEKDVSWARRLLGNYSWHMTSWYGWLSDKQKSKYLGLLDIKVKSLKEWVADRGGLVCPLCNVGNLVPRRGYDGVYHALTLPDGALIDGYFVKSGWTVADAMLEKYH